jgi:tetratricopeptide (TPR) repeat protein
MRKTLSLSVLATCLISASSGLYADTLTDEINKCNQSIKSQNAEQALTISAALLKQNNRLADAWLCQAKAFNLQSDAVHAEYGFSQALQFQTAEQDKMVTLGLLGNAEFQQEKFQQALEHYQQAYQMALNNNIKNYQRVTLNLIGDALTKLNRIDEAVGEYEKALKLTLNDTERADNLGRIANAYTAANNIDKAIEYQLRKIIASEKYGSPDQLADGNLELGRLYMLNKLYQQAYRSVNKVLEMASKNDSPFWMALSHVYLAQIDQRNNQFDSAKQHIQSAEKINQQLQDETISEEIKAVQKAM